MFDFHELTQEPVIDTFGYWLFVERRPIPNELFTVEYLAEWMIRHYDAEEQADVEADLRTNDELFPDFVRLIAPITLTERWTPFALAKSILGDPVTSAMGEPFFLGTPAMAVWGAEFNDEIKPECQSEHPRHFVFLLGIAHWCAREEGGRIVLIGLPGWSYHGWRSEWGMMHPMAALAMHRAGYIYTDRVAQ